MFLLLLSSYIMYFFYNFFNNFLMKKEYNILGLDSLQNNLHFGHEPKLNTSSAPILKYSILLSPIKWMTYEIISRIRSTAFSLRGHIEIGLFISSLKPMNLGLFSTYSK